MKSPYTLKRLGRFFLFDSQDLFVLGFYHNGQEYWLYSKIKADRRPIIEADFRLLRLHIDRETDLFLQGESI